VALIRINELIDRLLEYQPEADAAVVQKAYVWSAKLHAGSLRASGMPYLSHPLEVAEILTQLKQPADAIAAGLLHDVVEDSTATLDDLTREFGKEISRLVDGVTKIGKITPDATRIEVQAENYRKMILAMAQDVRVILIKLADRLHNMRTLEFLPEDRQRAIAQETMEIYAPIAGRLGIHWIQAQLEDLSFRHLKPDIYFRLAGQVARTREARQDYIDLVTRELEKRLQESGKDAKVSGRFKHLYSIYQKMDRQKLTFEEVHDLVAFRIMVPSIPDCYDALRVIHSFWTPVPGRIKDYIALPKHNMYRSLHTTVIGPEGERVEIQIRTTEMHAVAEYGIAAHWRYKEAGPAVSGQQEKTLEFLHHLVEFHEELKDPYHFLESLKAEVVPEEIIVFTPGGDMIELPAGATPIDFAFAIHSDIGIHAAGAKVNGRIVPLNHGLLSGDTAEIITSKIAEPSRAWLEIVKSTRAHAKIAHWISTREAEQMREMGRQVLESELLRHGKALGTLIEDGTMAQVAKRFNFSSYKLLFEAIGFGNFPARRVVTQLVPPEDLRTPTKRSKKAAKKSAKKIKKATSRKKTATLAAAADEETKPAVVIHSFNDPALLFAPCCRPLVGDEVVAVRSSEDLVEIHRADCPRGLEAHPERIIAARWADEVEGESEVAIEVIAKDMKGMLAKLSTVISSANLNIARATVHTTQEKKAIHTFNINLKHLSELQRLIKSIEKIDPVISVRRM